MPLVKTLVILEMKVSQTWCWCTFATVKDPTTLISCRESSKKQMTGAQCYKGAESTDAALQALQIKIDLMKKSFGKQIVRQRHRDALV